ncbi:hypothetical protein F5141DRAFT_1081518 [Pisolithus sp. B1]|nr:hypothetical protein F5141DRAFT_1081518 [Pisolithus sp. B1]
MKISQCSTTVSVLIPERWGYLYASTSVGVFVCTKSRMRQGLAETCPRKACTCYSYPSAARYPAYVSITTCPLLHTRCRQTCGLRIFRLGDTLKFLLPFRILPIKPSHHAVTKHVQVGPLVRQQICQRVHHSREVGHRMRCDIVNKHLTHRSTSVCRHRRLAARYRWMQEEFFFIACTHEEVCVFQAIQYTHCDSVSISQVEGASSVPYSQSYSPVPEYTDVSTLRNGIPIGAGSTMSAVRERLRLWI